MVAPGGSVVVLALKLSLDLAVDTRDQRRGKAVGDFEQRSIENLKLLLRKRESDGVHKITQLSSTF